MNIIFNIKKKSLLSLRVMKFGGVGLRRVRNIRSKENINEIKVKSSEDIC
jgi:hypothetical protein